MAYEWVMFNATVSRRKDKDSLFDPHAIRIHLLDGARQRESVGYVEQRMPMASGQYMFFLTVLRGERIEDLHIDDMQSGMDILDLVSREREGNEYR